MRTSTLKQWTALVLSVATLVGAVAEMMRSRADAADTYQNTALSAAETAEELAALRKKVEELEKRCGARP